MQVTVTIYEGSRQYQRFFFPAQHNFDFRHLYEILMTTTERVCFVPTEVHKYSDEIGA